MLEQWSECVERRKLNWHGSTRSQAAFFGRAALRHTSTLIKPTSPSPEALATRATHRFLLAGTPPRPRDRCRPFRKAHGRRPSAASRRLSCAPPSPHSPRSPRWSPPPFCCAPASVVLRERTPLARAVFAAHRGLDCVRGRSLGRVTDRNHAEAQGQRTDGEGQSSPMGGSSKAQL